MHMFQQHGVELQRDCIVKQTEIIARESDPRRLAFLEALYIKDLQPTINNQVQDLAILPSMKPINQRHLHRQDSENTEEERPPLGDHSLQAAPSVVRRPQEDHPPTRQATLTMPRRSARIEQRDLRPSQDRPANQHQDHL